MSKKVFAFTIIILLVLSIASPAFADVTPGDVTVFFPEPTVDEFAGWFSYKTTENTLITYAWTFLPYHGSVASAPQIGNASPYMEIDYNTSTRQFTFNLFPGFYEQANFIMYKYTSDLSTNVTAMVMTDYLTVSGAGSITYASGSSSPPVGYAFGGAVAINDAENSLRLALNITFSEDSNSLYNVELFYSFYRELMAQLMPELEQAFADIASSDEALQALANNSIDHGTYLHGIFQILTMQFMPNEGDAFTLYELIERDSAASRNTSTYTRNIQTWVIDIYEMLGNFYSDLLAEAQLANDALIGDMELKNGVTIYSAVDMIEGVVSNIDGKLFDFIHYELPEVNGNLVDITASIESLAEFFSGGADDLAGALFLATEDYLEKVYNDPYIVTGLLSNIAYETFYPVLDDVLGGYFDRNFCDDVVNALDDILAAINGDKAVSAREELDYNTYEDNSMSIFTLFNSYVLAPFRDFWSNISSSFKFDSGTQSSGNVIFDYLFDGDKLPGLNNLESVDWSTLP